MSNLTMGVNYWAAADEAYGRGQQAYLDWCKEIAKLYAEGTKTQEQIAERYDTDQQRVSKAVQVGNDRRISLINLKIELLELTAEANKPALEFANVYKSFMKN